MALGGITLSSGLRNNLSSLQSLGESIGRSNLRLSTGKRINEASDGALQFFTSQNFADKAKAYDQVKNALGISLSTITTATKNLDQLKSLVESAAGQLRGALTSAGTNAKLTSAFNFTALADDFAPVAGSTTQFDDADVLKISILNPSGAVASNVAITVAGKTVGQVIDQINGDIVLNPPGSGARVRAFLSNGTSGSLVIENAETNSSSTTAVGAGNAVGLQLDLTNAGVVQDLRTVFNYSGVPAGALGTATATSVQVFGTTNVTRQAAFSAFQTTLEQINKYADDAGFNGVNLLKGDSLTTYFNQDNTTFLRTSGQVISATNLSFGRDNSKGTVVTGATFDNTQTTLSRNFQSDSEIKSALTNLNGASQSLVALNQTLSASTNVIKSRQSYTNDYIKIHDAAADDLVSADINEEGANLLSLQTRQQLAIQALSLASQSDQAVLRLF